MDQYIGKMLDNRYEVLDILGVGGMAVVYKAYCHRLHRFVALKVLKKDLASDADFRRRFHEEAQAVAMLSHPNIVSVYDVSRGDDLDYIVMELIDGITLKQYMQKKEGTLPWKEALYFVTQILRALSHAHSRGIIHRDIKPQNIMVLRDGSVKVADFGIARVMTASQNSLTKEAIGSVHYMSPEQARGSHMDARADIYSSGVVLYEMLTGRLPFDGDTPVSVAMQHINAVPLSPRELDLSIPEGLEEITLKAMASRIDQRYISADAMIRDLEEFRKNPQTVFHYRISAFSGNQPMPDEPTQILDTSRNPARPEPRQRPPKPPRPASPPKQPAPSRPVKPEEAEGKKRNVVIPVVIVAFLTVVAVILWVTFFSGLFNKADRVEVPTLVGMTMEDVYADDTLKFKVVKRSSENSDFPEGQIIEQSPESGETAEEGSTIYVTVSSGQETMKMINLTGKTYESAVAAVQEMGLNVANPTYAASDEVEKGKVISFTPTMGAEVMAGDTVSMVVSSGPEVRKYVVPSVVGETLENARRMLENVELRVAGVDEVYSDEKAGRVVYQSIAPSTEVEAGTSIVLNVSKGPEPTQEEHTGTVDVALPQDGRESVTVQITVDGNVAYENVVDTEVGSISAPVTGTGTQHICVYLDGELVDEYDKDFGT